MKQTLPHLLDLFIFFLDASQNKYSFKNLILISITLTTLLFFITSITLIINRKKKRIAPSKNLEINSEKIPQKSINVKEETIQHIINGLQKLASEKYFLSSNCNAYNTAKKINTNTTYLSKVINSHYNKSFNTYINEFRIQYILDKLKSEKHYRSYSIQSLSEEVGYKSPDSFTKAFKIYTGFLPSVYIKNIGQNTNISTSKVF